MDSEESTMTTSYVQGNEIVKADDFNYGFESLINNVSKFAQMVFETENDFIIGGKVRVYNGLNVVVSPVFGVCAETGTPFGMTADSDSIPVTSSTTNRIDILEAKGTWVTFDNQQRGFNDLDNNVITFQYVDTKKRLKVEFNVKMGSEGSAPDVDSGYVKIAEIHVPANAEELTESDIYNITSDIAGLENEGWTNEKDITYNAGTFSDVNGRFREQHNEDGTHKDNIITTKELDIGINSTQVNGSVLPSGKEINIDDTSLIPSTTIADVLLKIAEELTKVYESYIKLGNFAFNGEISVSDLLDSEKTALSNALKIGTATTVNDERYGYLKIADTEILKIFSDGKITESITGQNYKYVTEAVTNAISQTISIMQEQISNIIKTSDSTYYTNLLYNRFHTFYDVDYATTDNVELSGLQNVDGTVMKQDGLIVLVKNQTENRENGIYSVVTTGSWSRVSDFDTYPEKLKNIMFSVKNGSSNYGKCFYWAIENITNIDGAKPTYSNITDEIAFVESSMSKYQLADKIAVRNSNGMLSDLNDTETTTANVWSAAKVTKVLKGYRNRKMIDRWLRFNFEDENHKSVIIKANTVLTINDTDYQFEADASFDLSNYITKGGKDYFIFANISGDTVSLSAYTEKSADYGTYIGRCHTLCVDAGTMSMIAPAEPSCGLSIGDSYLVKTYSQETDSDFYNFYNRTVTGITSQTYYDVVTCEHPLSGFKAGEILPESIFCLNFKPDCLAEDAMVYDKDTDITVDVYLQSGKGNKTRSAYGATHTVSRQAQNHMDDFRQVGKRMLTDGEFASIALGSNEKTNIAGSSDQTTVGGHTDTAGRRTISAIGVEEACGYIWQWLDEIGPAGGSGWNTYDGHASFGSHYGGAYQLVAGGGWGDGSNCGSRSRLAHLARSYVSADLGSRGSSRL